MRFGFMPVNPQLTPIALVIIGLFLFLIAPRVVGFFIKIVGIFLLLAGGAAYLFKPVAASFPGFAPIIPIIAGLSLIFVGKGIAQMVLRFAGLAVIVWGLLGLGVI
jgi:hypothetical protein